MPSGGRQAGFAEVLRATRERRGMTQQQLADLSTVSMRAIRNLELGITRRPRRDTLRLVVQSLGLAGVERAEFERAAGLPTPVAPSPRSLHRPRSAVLSAAPPPSPPDELVGREDEVGALAVALDDRKQRLVVLTGLGGVGKSRVALAVAERLHAAGESPVLWTIDPSGRSGPADPVRCWLDGTGDGTGYGTTDGSGDGSGGGTVPPPRRAVLVLDGFEPSATRRNRLALLLAEHRELQVLVTARRPFGLPGEHATAIGPLPVTDQDGHEDLVSTPAMRLLMRSAGSTRRPGPVGPPEAAALVSLCQLLDGIPVALKAAGTLLRIYQPDALVEHITADLCGFAAAVPGLGEPTDLHAAASAVLESLEVGDYRVLLRLAATARGWSMPDAVTLTGLAPANCAAAVSRLLGLGAVRVHGQPAERRFRVLNLVRELGQRSERPALRLTGDGARCDRTAL